MIHFLETQFSFFPWNSVYGGNTFSEYVEFFLFFLFLLFFCVIGQKILLFFFQKLAQKTKTGIDDAIVRIIEMVRPPFSVFLAFYIAIDSLEITGIFSKIIDAVMIIWVTWQIISAIQITFEYALNWNSDFLRDKGRKNVILLFVNIGKGILWAVGFLVVLSNLGVNISSLIAGLGVSGIVIAFALQSVLQDLSSSLSIYFDRPFEPGDFVVVGGSYTGTVQHIGIKSTRIKSIQGEEIVISNKELTSSVIQNYKKMERRRVVLTFGLSHDTETEKMKTIPSLFEEIFLSLDRATLDRVHFKSFDENALLFEVVYFIESREYPLYMDIRQEINYRLKEIFSEKDISFILPSQKIFLKHEDS
ncbi:MAG: mechanosensitive ion channel family protein [Candidatus Moraniibacteriota bacterium]|nr:MAG: mechanosensitive ion channel family protein [Candidatus Moranbacteria bacterium]